MAVNYTYNGKKLNDKATTNYVNIATNRTIARTDRKDFVYYNLATVLGHGPNIYICGFSNALQKFFRQNFSSSELILSRVFTPDGELRTYDLEIPKSPRPKSPEPRSEAKRSEAKAEKKQEVKIQRPGVHVPLSVHSPPVSPRTRALQMASMAGVSAMSAVRGPDAKMITTVRPECKASSPGTVLYTPNSNNIRSIPDEAFKYLCLFNLSGLSGMGRVLSVVDGDTITMALYIDLHSLSLGRVVTYERKRQVLAPILTEAKSSGFISMFRCRLDQIDAAEHDTPQGKKAIELTKQLYNHYHGYVYYEAQNMDKYGRLLVRLYADESHTIYLNRHLIDQKDPIGPLAEWYNGGTKSEYMKNLSKQAASDRDGKGAVESKEEVKESKEERRVRSERRSENVDIIGSESTKDPDDIVLNSMGESLDFLS